jgi:DNA polymerase III subunit gamma/tau
MTFYRKYRPQTVAELDLTSVRQSLASILATGKFSHAYLFAGPKGTGKTSSARILAKVVNCERNRQSKSPTPQRALLEPCNECGSCKAVMNGLSFSVLEIDAASNRGIDDIRLLRERVALAPVETPYTVYVIDEVHMLTTEAFNALLKTLEEPPAHAIFVLCTTETHKIPETILSRCNVVPFTKATSAEVVRSLGKAVVGEVLEIEPAALSLIAERVDGSFRDGMKYLEQLSQLNRMITGNDVDEAMGFGNGYDPDPFIQALVSRDISRGLTEITAKGAQGIDLFLFGKRVVEKLRITLMAEVVKPSRDEVAIQDLIHLLDRVSQSVLAMKQAVVSSLPLEIVVVERGLQAKAPALKPDEPVAPLKAIKPPIQVMKPVEPKKVIARDGKDITVEEVQAKWPSIMRGVRPHNHSLEALLRAARPLETKGNTIVIEVFYTFHKEQLEQDRHLAIMEKVLQDVLSTPVRLVFVLGDKVKQAAKRSGTDVANITGKIEDENVAGAAEEIFGS